MGMDIDPIKLSDVRALTASGAARTIRTGARLSLSEVGAACGVGASAVHRWETGRRSPRGEAALRYGALLRALQGSAR